MESLKKICCEEEMGKWENYRRVKFSLIAEQKCWLKCQFQIHSGIRIHYRIHFLAANGQRTHRMRGSNLTSQKQQHCDCLLDQQKVAPSSIKSWFTHDYCIIIQVLIYLKTEFATAESGWKFLYIDLTNKKSHNYVQIRLWQLYYHSSSYTVHSRTRFAAAAEIWWKFASP